MPDSILYQGEDYGILHVSSYEGLFDPAKFGISPAPLHTAARRGFVCRYSVANEILLLSSLEIRAKDGLYPSINDAISSFPSLEEIDPSELFLEIETEDASGRMVWRCNDYAVYREIETPIAYTGTWRIGQDADWRYVRNVFPGLLDWMYRIVFDLKFVDGHLQSAADLSTDMARIRREQATASEYHRSWKR